MNPGFFFQKQIACSDGLVKSSRKQDHSETGQWVLKVFHEGHKIRAVEPGCGKEMNF